MNNPSTRPWEWTPPPAMNGIMSTMLRLPVLHQALSKEILLLTFTGRKSKKRMTTPVGYLKEGQTVTLLTKRFRKWWHNFETPAAVEARIQGKNYRGTAQAITDDATTIPIITHLMQSHHREAEIYGVRLNADGTPNPDDIRALAPKVVVIRVNLA